MDIDFDPPPFGRFDFLLKSIKDRIRREVFPIQARLENAMKLAGNVIGMHLIPLPQTPTVTYRIKTLTDSDRFVRYVAAQVASGRGEISFTSQGEMVFHLRITRDDVRDQQDWNLVGVDDVWLYFTPPQSLTNPTSSARWLD